MLTHEECLIATAERSAAFAMQHPSCKQLWSMPFAMRSRQRSRPPKDVALDEMGPGEEAATLTRLSQVSRILETEKLAITDRQYYYRELNRLAANLLVYSS